MKACVFFGSFVLVAASASTAFAYYPANYWRCTADQLYGSPLASFESRQAYGRVVWARDAYKWFKYGKGANPAHADRYWQGWMNAEVDSAASAPYFIDLYPVYLDGSAVSGIWKGPGPHSTAKWFGTTFTQIKSRPYELPNQSTQVDALCEAGCYTPEQEVRFGDEYVPIARAYASAERKVTTLAPHATFDSLNFIVNDIARWTVDVAPAEQTIITLHMESGGELRVTTEHPVMTGEGVLKRAMDLVIGEPLVREDGSSDPIVAMDQQTVVTKVYNLRPATTDLMTNIIVAQGYLNGSARYQSEYLKYLNRVLIRQNIPAELIPRGRSSGARDAGEKSATRG